MRKRLLLALSLLILGTICSPAGEPFRYPEAKQGKGRLQYVNGLPVLFVEGSPEEIGEQVAILGLKPAGKLLNYPRDVLDGYYPQSKVIGINRETGKEIAWRGLLAICETMVEHFPADHKKEFDALAKAHGGQRELLLAANTMFDVKKMFSHDTFFFGCSSLVISPERSATGHAFMGRNLDFPTMGYLQDYTLVTVYKPTGKHAFVSIGFPGMIGIISGMNDAGLALAVLEVYNSKDGSARYQNGQPYAMTYRRMLEECTTIEEAIKLLEGTKRTTMCNLAVCDKNAGGILEITPKSVIYRKPEDGVCPCTNHFNSAELAKEGQNNLYNTLERFQKLSKVKECPKVALIDLAARLHDANLGDATLQTMIFQPTEMKLHLSLAPCPSSQHLPRELDVGEMVKR
jgi:isopenicillin-N N-acyltransferase like protein